MFSKAFLILFFLQTCVSKKLDERNNRENTQWSWGYVDEDQSKNRVTLEELHSTTTTTEQQQAISHEDQYPKYEDFCEPYNKSVPDFSAPGRRISRVKCYEYIWDIKYQETKISRASACKRQLAERKHYEEFLEKLKRENNGVLPNMYTYSYSPPQEGHAYGARATVAGEFSHMVSNNPFDVNIKRIRKHPCYKAPKKYYDIALLELEHDITEFKKELQPACIWGDYDTSSLGTKATLTGWGVTETDKNISPNLLAADVEIIEPGLCDRLLRLHRNRNWHGLKEHQICGANLTGGVDACQGDSGGPLQMKMKLPMNQISTYHIIGIVSFGVDCGRPNTPGIYTRVSSFVDWIENIVWSQDHTESFSDTTMCPR